MGGSSIITRFQKAKFKVSRYLCKVFDVMKKSKPEFNLYVG